MAELNCSCGRQLPLTIPRGGPDLEGVDEAVIRQIVDSFYGRVREDELLGPVFNEVIDDWDAHMPKMYRFWSSVALRTGTYSGRPMEAHLGLPGVTAAHFGRWIDLWEEVVAAHVPEEATKLLVGMAMRMGRVMSEPYRESAAG